jgi:hypothetical protein
MHRLFSRCWNLQVTLYAYSCHAEMGSTWCGLNVIRPRPWPGSVLPILAAEFSRFLWRMIQVVMSQSIPSWLPVSLDFVTSEPQFSMSLSDHNSGVYTVCVGAICAAISVFALSRSLPYRMHHIRPCSSFFGLLFPVYCDAPCSTSVSQREIVMCTYMNSPNCVILVIFTSKDLTVLFVMLHT